MVFSKLFNVASAKAMLAAAVMAPLFAAGTAQADSDMVHLTLSSNSGRQITVSANSDTDQNYQYRFEYKQEHDRNWTVLQDWGQNTDRARVRFDHSMTPQRYGLVLIRVKARERANAGVQVAQKFFFEEQARDTERIAPTDIRFSRGVKYTNRPMTLSFMYVDRSIPATATREFFTWREGDEFIHMHGEETISRDRGELRPGTDKWNAFHNQSWTPRRAGKHYVGVRITWTTADGYSRTHYRVETIRVYKLPVREINTNAEIRVREDINKKPVMIIKTDKKSPKKTKKPVIVIKP